MNGLKLFNILICFYYFISGWISSLYWGFTTTCEIFCLHMVQLTSRKTEIFQKTRKKNVVRGRKKMQRWTYGKELLLRIWYKNVILVEHIQTFLVFLFFHLTPFKLYEYLFWSQNNYSFFYCGKDVHWRRNYIFFRAIELSFFLYLTSRLDILWD